VAGDQLAGLLMVLIVVVMTILLAIQHSCVWRWSTCCSS